MIAAVLGASDNPERYSYQAVKLLGEKGHEVFPINPSLKEIDGLKVFSSLKGLPKSIHTLSIYLSKAVSSKLTGEILESKPKRIIFNPGAENPELMAAASKNGIQAIEACTLVLLRTNQFEG